jgi:hypothetical protein
MLSSVVSDIVCNTYTSQFRDRTPCCVMIVRFRMVSTHECELAIYSPRPESYVNVMVRNVFNREPGPWTVLWYSNNRWREDGVRRWLHENSDAISCIEGLSLSATELTPNLSQVDDYWRVTWPVPSVEEGSVD